MTNNSADDAVGVRDAGPRFNLAGTLAAWTVYGAACVTLMSQSNEAFFRAWPLGIVVVLCLAMSPIIGLAFTSVRCLLCANPNRGRWLTGTFACAFAVSYIFWLWWGPLLVFATGVTGYLLDKLVSPGSPSRP